MIDRVDTMPATRQSVVDEYFAAEAAYWDDLYDMTGLEGSIYRKRKETVLSAIESLPLPRRGRVLEVGCGAGSLTCDLVRDGYIVTAVDTVPAMLNATRTRLARKGMAHNAVVIAGDLHELPLPSNLFDLVVAVGVIPWLHSPEQALREIRRVLLPEAHVVITSDNRLRLSRYLDPRVTPLLDGIRGKLKALLIRAGLWKRDTLVVANMLTPAQFDTMLESAGFVVERSVTVGYGPFTFFGRSIFSESFQQRVDRLLSRLNDAGWRHIRYAGNHYIVVARSRPNVPKEITACERSIMGRRETS